MRVPIRMIVAATLLIATPAHATRAETEAQCKAKLDEAETDRGLRTSKGYLDAIHVAQKVFALDPERDTEFPKRAETSIAASKKLLHDLAKPLVAQAKALQAKKDWVNARIAVRKAIAADPYDVTLQLQLDTIDAEVRASEKHAMPGSLDP
jgi:hypothetical protein